MSEVKVSGQDMELLRATFQKFDVQIDEAMGQLDLRLDRLGSAEMSKQEKYDLVVDSEYMLVRLRSLVMKDITGCGRALSAAGLTSLYKQMFTDRRNNMYVLCQRINELRDDFQTIQRTVYVGKMSNF